MYRLNVKKYELNHMDNLINIQMLTCLLYAHKKGVLINNARPSFGMYNHQDRKYLIAMMYASGLLFRIDMQKKGQTMHMLMQEQQRHGQL